LFATLQAADPYGHLKGMHNAGPWYDHRKPWITHVEAQENYRLDSIVAHARRNYRKPIVIDEFGYEGDVGPTWGNLTGQDETSRFWDVVMAGGYASHGEAFVHPGGLLWWGVGGELVGESPARLGFLKEILSAAPFQDLEPAPNLVMGGSALARQGQ